MACEYEAIKDVVAWIIVLSFFPDNRMCCSGREGSDDLKSLQGLGNIEAMRWPTSDRASSSRTINYRRLVTSSSSW